MIFKKKFKERRISRFSLIGLIAISLTTALTATEIHVKNLLDSGQGSLREALIHVNDDDRIVFESNLSGVIHLESPLPLINGDLSIYNNPENCIVIDGGDRNQIFFVNKGVVSISNITLCGGMSRGGNGGQSFGGNGGGGLGAGGALFVNSKAIVLFKGVVFENNKACGGNGSGFFNIYSAGSGGGGGGGYNQGNGGDGSYDFGYPAGGGGGGGFCCHGGSGFLGGGGGGGFTGVINHIFSIGSGEIAATTGGNGGHGYLGADGGQGGGFSFNTHGTNGSQQLGGGGGGGHGETMIDTLKNGGSGGSGGIVGGGGGGGCGHHGGYGGSGGDFSGGGGGGGGLIHHLTASGGSGGFGGGGGGGGSASGHSEKSDGKGGNGGFGAGGGGGGKNALGGLGGLGGGAGNLTADRSSGGGGGGAGMGGAVFVRTGGRLELKNCQFSNNQVVAGLGGNANNGGFPGEAWGRDIYVMEKGCVSFDAQTYSSDLEVIVEGAFLLIKRPDHSQVLKVKVLGRGEKVEHHKVVFD